jgi:3-deoxy-D-manno-octulosonic-acid transferase
MSRSLAFAAYRALSRRKSRPSLTNAGPRPKGEVLWLHATSTNRFSALLELGQRVQSLREDLLVLITTETDKTEPPMALSHFVGTSVHVDNLTSDHPGEIRHFLDHWRPNICLWAGAVLMPNLINEATDRGVPMFLIDVKKDDLAPRKHKWFPDLTRSCLDQFEKIMTNDVHTSAMIRRLGLPGRKISLTEPLRNGPSPLPFPEEDLSAVTERLARRPVWLAAHAQADEFISILAAQRKALRLLHQLLLVLIVANPSDLDRLESTMQGSELRHARWKIGDEIDDNTQVLITDGQDDLGLWYRVAPLTFIASSLNAAHSGHNPLEAVALGSAVLFGPHVSNYKGTYTRLTAVGAGQAVGDAEALGDAVIRLIAPDQVAAMALAGWQVVTEGAKLTDQLVDLVLDRLDIGRTDHART